MRLSPTKYICSIILLTAAMESKALASEICKIAVRKMAVFYTPRMLAINPSISPSSMKPRQFVRKLLAAGLPVKIISPKPVSFLDFYSVHERKFVNDILMLRTPNGFGSESEKINNSLTYTSGSLLEGAKYAIRHKTISCSPTSGFHHAGHSFCGGFCTFNGLVLTATKIIDYGLAKRVAIIDADYHWGNGTEDLLSVNPYRHQIFHYSFGLEFSRGMAERYILKMRALEYELSSFEPDLIIYQAGADAHIDDPLGGVLNSAQMRERDQVIFNISRKLAIPLVWNLAGGYNFDKTGKISPVLDLHQQTAEAAIEAISP